jgi:hypothetical protein
VKAGVPVQLCMPVPSDVLTSVMLPGVSNIRASQDNDLTYAVSYRWSIGLTSLLHGALDIRPFADNAWTTATYTGEDAKGVPYPAGYVQNATELGIAISALSTGPVGLGDKLNFTNATLANLACASNGVLLKPSLPASPVDAFWQRPADGSVPPMQSQRSEVWQAHSFITIVNMDVGGSDASDAVNAAARLPSPHPNGLHRFAVAADMPREQVARDFAPRDTFPSTTSCPFATLLAVDIPAEFNYSFGLGDFTPSLDGTPSGSGACSESGLAPSGYVALAWSPGLAALSKLCADGVPALGCIQPLGSGQRIHVATGVAPNQMEKGAFHPFEILSLSPLLTNGYALLGEIGKFTRVSPVRFTGIVASSNGSGDGPGMTTWVAGAADETVDVAVLVPGQSGLLKDALIRRVSVSFGSSGGAKPVACTGTGASATCTVGQG